MILLVTIVISLACDASSLGVLKYSEYGRHVNDLESRLSTGDFSPANCTAEEYTRFCVDFFSKKMPNLGITTMAHIQWMASNSPKVYMSLSEYDKYTTSGSCGNSVVDEKNRTMSWSSHLRPLSVSERETYKNGVPFLSYNGLPWCNLVCWNIVDFYQSSPSPSPEPAPMSEPDQKQVGTTIINNYYGSPSQPQAVQQVVYRQQVEQPVYYPSQSRWNVNFGVNYGYNNNCYQPQPYCVPQPYCQPVQTCVPYQPCGVNYPYYGIHAPLYSGCTNPIIPIIVSDGPHNGPNGGGIVSDGPQNGSNRYAGNTNMRPQNRGGYYPQQGGRPSNSMAQNGQRGRR